MDTDVINQYKYNKSRRDGIRAVIEKIQHSFMVFTKRAFVIINPTHRLHNDIMYTSHSVSLTQSTSRTLTIQC